MQMMFCCLLPNHNFTTIPDRINQFGTLSGFRINWTNSEWMQSPVDTFIAIKNTLNNKQLFIKYIYIYLTICCKHHGIAKKNWPFLPFLV